MNTYEYNKEIESIVINIVEEVKEETGTDDTDNLYEACTDRLHETIDGHQWVIYTAYHNEVLNISDNAECGLDEGLIQWEAGESSYGQLTMGMTYWAMYEDCIKLLYDEAERQTA